MLMLNTWCLTFCRHKNTHTHTCIHAYTVYIESHTAGCATWAEANQRSPCWILHRRRARCGKRQAACWSNLRKLPQVCREHRVRKSHALGFFAFAHPDAECSYKNIQESSGTVSRISCKYPEAVCYLYVCIYAFIRMYVNTYPHICVAYVIRSVCMYSGVLVKGLRHIPTRKVLLILYFYVYMRVYVYVYTPVYVCMWVFMHKRI